MLGVILNEQEIVKNILQGNKDSKIKTYNKMVMLVKYFLEQGGDTEITLVEEVLKVLEKTEDNFKRIYWEEKTLDTVKRLLRKKNGKAGLLELTNINKIPITQKEIDTILAVKNKVDKKVLFIMLLYAKISNVIFHSTEGWFNQERKNIFKEAKVSGCRTDKEKSEVIYRLVKEGYITKNKRTGNLGLKVNFIDNEENPKIVFEVTDLADCHAIYSYLIYIGEKWKRCEVCGKYIKEGKTKKIKYCSDCAKKINLEKTKMNLRENIKMKK